MFELPVYFWLAITAWAAGPSTAPAQPDGPRPALAPVSWELRFRYDDPQRVAVILPDRPSPVVYWYMLYRVENTGDREVDFYPQFTLVTDTLQIVPSETAVSPEAFRAIQRRVGDSLLVPPERAIGRLLRGREHARRSVAIWPDFDPRATGFRIYVAGLSGETLRLRNPGFDPSQPENDTNVRHFVLRKTLEIPYLLPSGESTRDRAIPRRLEDKVRWIMR